MNDLNKYFDKYKKLENQEPLFDKHALEKHILTGQAKFKLSRILNRRIIMTFSSIAILSTAAIISIFNWNTSTVQQDTKQADLIIKTETIVDEFTVDTLVNKDATVDIREVKKDNSSFSQTKQADLKIKTEKISDESNVDTFSKQDVPKQSRVHIIQTVSIDEKKKPALSINNILNEYDIPAMNMIELTTEQIEKLNIEVKNEDMKIHIEAIVDTIDLDFYLNQYKEKGYDINNLPILVKKILNYDSKLGLTEYTLEYKNWDVDDYNKLCHIGQHSLYSSNRIARFDLNLSPLLLNEGKIYKNFYKYCYLWKKTYRM